MLGSEAGELYDYYTGGRSPQVFFAERPSRSSDWKLRAGKRAASEWQFRDAKLLGGKYAMEWSNVYIQGGPPPGEPGLG